MKLSETNRWTSGKSPKKHFYTVQDIADVSGKAVGTVRNDSAKGKLDLDSLASVVRYCRAAVKRDNEAVSAVRGLVEG